MRGSGCGAARRPDRIAELRPWLLVLYALGAVASTVLVFTLRASNNFVIFRTSHLHLLTGRDLYAPDPERYHDLFKYSPTFALLFGPFARLPTPAALLAWNLLNALLLFYAVDRLLPRRQAAVALALLSVGYAVTTDGSQSNPLVAALIVLAFEAFERREQVRAALAFAVFHPRRVRFTLIFLAALGLVAALPLLVVAPGALAAQYESWARVEAVDALDRGRSALEELHRWLRVDWPNWPVQLAGTALLLLPVLLRPARWRDADFRRTFLCSVLIYVVLFNHQAERESYVIASTGLAIWYAPSRPRPLSALLALATLLIAQPLPFLIAWLVMQAQLLDLRLGEIPALARAAAAGRRHGGAEAQ
jgi:hypothetical protein